MAVCRCGVLRGPSIEFVVDGEPVPKMRPRLTRGGRAYTPQRTRDYEYKVGDLARQAIRIAEWDATPGKYALSVTVYRNKRIGDLDNFIKSIADGMNGIVWPDDRMVVAIDAFMDDTEPTHSRAVVRVTKLQPQS